MNPQHVHKVIAYVTCGEQLLVFRHTEFPEAGIQVPAGTLEPGEDPANAVIREVCEETDLEEEKLIQHSKLGEDTIEALVNNLQDVVSRHFYHIEFVSDPPERWIHYEMDPCDGSPAPIEFELYWVAFPGQVPQLEGDQAAMLGKLNLSR